MTRLTDYIPLAISVIEEGMRSSRYRIADPFSAQPWNPREANTGVGHRINPSYLKRYLTKYGFGRIEGEGRGNHPFDESSFDWMDAFSFDAPDGESPAARQSIRTTFQPAAFIRAISSEDISDGNLASLYANLVFTYGINSGSRLVALASSLTDAALSSVLRPWREAARRTIAFLPDELEQHPLSELYDERRREIFTDFRNELLQALRQESTNAEENEDAENGGGPEEQRIESEPELDVGDMAYEGGRLYAVANQDEDGNLLYSSWEGEPWRGGFDDAVGMFHHLFGPEQSGPYAITRNGLVGRRNGRPLGSADGVNAHAVEARRQLLAAARRGELRNFLVEAFDEPQDDESSVVEQEEPSEIEEIPRQPQLEFSEESNYSIGDGVRPDELPVGTIWNGPDSNPSMNLGWWAVTEQGVVNADTKAQVVDLYYRVLSNHESDGGAARPHNTILLAYGRYRGRVPYRAYHGGNLRPGTVIRKSNGTEYIYLGNQAAMWRVATYQGSVQETLADASPILIRPFSVQEARFVIDLENWTESGQHVTLRDLDVPPNGLQVRLQTGSGNAHPILRTRERATYLVVSNTKGVNYRAGDSIIEPTTISGRDVRTIYVEDWPNIPEKWLNALVVEQSPWLPEGEEIRQEPWPDEPEESKGQDVVVGDEVIIYAPGYPNHAEGSPFHGETGTVLRANEEDWVIKESRGRVRTVPKKAAYLVARPPAMELSGTSTSSLNAALKLLSDIVGRTLLVDVGGQESLLDVMGVETSDDGFFLNAYRATNWAQLKSKRGTPAHASKILISEVTNIRFAEEPPEPGPGDIVRYIAAGNVIRYGRYLVRTGDSATIVGGPTYSQASSQIRIEGLTGDIVDVSRLEKVPSQEPGPILLDPPTADDYGRIENRNGETVAVAYTGKKTLDGIIGEKFLLHGDLNRGVQYASGEGSFASLNQFLIDDLVGVTLKGEAVEDGLIIASRIDTGERLEERIPLGAVRHVEKGVAKPGDILRGDSQTDWYLVTRVDNRVIGIRNTGPEGFNERAEAIRLLNPLASEDGIEIPDWWTLGHEGRSDEELDLVRAGESSERPSSDYPVPTVNLQSLEEHLQDPILAKVVDEYSRVIAQGGLLTTMTCEIEFSTRRRWFQYEKDELVDQNWVAGGDVGYRDVRMSEVLPGADATPGGDYGPHRLNAINAEWMEDTGPLNKSWKGAWRAKSPTGAPHDQTYDVARTHEYASPIYSWTLLGDELPENLHGRVKLLTGPKDFFRNWGAYWADHWNRKYSNLAPCFQAAPDDRRTPPCGAHRHIGTPWLQEVFEGTGALRGELSFVRRAQEETLLVSPLTLGMEASSPYVRHGKRRASHRFSEGGTYSFNESLHISSKLDGRNGPLRGLTSADTDKFSPSPVHKRKGTIEFRAHDVTFPAYQLTSMMLSQVAFNAGLMELGLPEIEESHEVQTKYGWTYGEWTSREIPFAHDVEGFMRQEYDAMKNTGLQDIDVDRYLKRLFSYYHFVWERIGGLDALPESMKQVLWLVSNRIDAGRFMEMLRATCSVTKDDVPLEEQYLRYTELQDAFMQNPLDLYQAIRSARDKNGEYLFRDYLQDSENPVEDALPVPPNDYWTEFKKKYVGRRHIVVAETDSTDEVVITSPETTKFGKWYSHHAGGEGPVPWNPLPRVWRQSDKIEVPWTDNILDHGTLNLIEAKLQNGRSIGGVCYNTDARIISGLFVVPEYRTRGVGTKLLTEAVERVTESDEMTATGVDSTYVQFHVPDDSPEGFRLAGKFGAQVRLNTNDKSQGTTVVVCVHGQENRLGNSEIVPAIQNLISSAEEKLADAAREDAQSEAEAIHEDGTQGDA